MKSGSFDNADVSTSSSRTCTASARDHVTRKNSVAKFRTAVQASRSAASLKKDQGVTDQMASVLYINDRAKKVEPIINIPSRQEVENVFFYSTLRHIFKNTNLKKLQYYFFKLHKFNIINKWQLNLNSSS